MNKEFQLFIESFLTKRKNDKLYRQFKVNTANSGAYVDIDSRKVLQMSSNNYLGLANDERIKQASIDAINEFGIGSTGSRLISGTHELHIKLEKKIAKLKETDKALYFSTGYAANIGIITAIAGKNDAIYSDELNHASIIDGIKLSSANKHIYKHCDMQNLEKLLEENAHKYRFNFIITDSVFSMDGDLAPLTEIIGLKEKYNAILMIDEAHSFGVFGKKGQGLAKELGVNRQVDIQMGTFSKAAGVEGGYVAANCEIIDFLIQKSRSFIYSTAPAISTIAGCIESLNRIENDCYLRENLHLNIKYLKTELSKLSEEKRFTLLNNNTAIFCLEFNSLDDTLEISNKLFNNYSIMALAVRPPTVKTPRIRICTMAKHKESDIKHLINSLNFLI